MDRRKELREAFAAAFPHTLPVLTGFLVLGMAYGVLMRSKGYPVYWSVCMSAVAFCGSMQFVAITLLTAVFNPIQAFLLSLMVNARHLFYGISMLDKYKGLGKARQILIFMLCDETFSISSATEVPEDINRKYFYMSISILDYSYWIMGTFFGGVIGELARINTKGLDFVLTALFVVLFMNQMEVKQNRISGIIGLLCTTVCLFVFGGGNVVIPSMILILVILLAGRKRLCR